MLSKRYRLKKNYQFNYIYKKGVSVSSKILVLIYAKRKNGINIGFSVSNKIGKAVVRNKVKRRLRHSARELIKSFNNGYSYIFIARSPIVQASYQEIVNTMCYQISKLKTQK